MPYDILINRKEEDYMGKVKYISQKNNEKDYEQLETIYQKLKSYSFKVTIKCYNANKNYEKEDVKC